MRKLPILFVVLLCCCGLSAQITDSGKEVHSTPSASPYTTASVSPVAGDFGIIAFDTANDVTPSSCTCGTNTFTKANGGGCGGATAGRIQIWTKTNLASGSCTPSCSFGSTPGAGEMQYIEFGNVDTTTGLDAASNCNTGTSTNPTGTTVAVNFANDAIYAFYGSGTSNVGSAGSGYTFKDVDGFISGEFKLSVSSSEAPSFTKISSTWVVLSISIKQASAGANPGTNKRSKLEILDPS